MTDDELLERMARWECRPLTRWGELSKEEREFLKYGVRPWLPLVKGAQWALQYGVFDVAIDNQMHAKALDDFRRILNEIVGEKK